MSLVAVATEIAREAKCFRVNIGDVIFKHNDVLIGDSFFGALATEFA